MSAWDIAGAVVWTLFLAFWIIALVNDKTNAGGKLVSLVGIVTCALLAIYCIARLFGANA